MKYIRNKHGNGFSYSDKDRRMLDPRKKEDRETKEWIESLAIPPAWSRVRISNNLKAKVFASGRDANGKKQYIYNPAWREKRNQQKFERIQRFGNNLEQLRAITAEHLQHFSDQDDTRKSLSREAVLACMVRLIESAYFRPGNLQYTQENESFGLTTLRSKHLHIDDDELTFEYRGKAGVEQHKTVIDEKLSTIVAELDKQPGYRIFKYYRGAEKVYVNSEDLNDYIRSIMGEEFSAKDFRTWAGTVITAIELGAQSAQNIKQLSEKELNKLVMNALAVASERLGNSPAICRENYVDPRVIEAFLDGETINDYLPNEDEDDALGLSEQEAATLDLLESIN